MTLSTLAVQFAPGQDAQAAGSPLHGSASHDQEQVDLLVRLATEALNGNDSFIVRTRFSIDPGKHTFFYDGKPLAKDLVLSKDDPLAQPLEALIRAEVLHRDFQSAIPAERFWRDSLNSIITTIKYCVLRPASLGPTMDATSPLGGCTNEVETQFDNLKTSTLAFAANRGLRPAEPIRLRDPAAGYHVNVEIVPPKARVRVMTLLQYKKYQYSQTPRDLFQWNDLLAAENMMIGWYHYRAEWPSDLNGPEEGDFEVKGPITLKFTPAPK